MAELSTIARPYAEAVFELAKETEDFSEWSDILNFLQTIIEDPQMSQVVDNPRVDKATLTDLWLALCDTQISEAGKNLVQLLVAHRRLRAIPHIVRQYEALKANYQGYIQVEIASPYEVTPSQQQELESILQRRLGKAIDFNMTLDQSLIGGWLIRAGDQVIDASIKGRLQQLAINLRY
jgi:F-type H+-transporting ATPase subunit delta